jgi:hypothetical protein
MAIRPTNWTYASPHGEWVDPLDYVGTSQAGSSGSATAPYPGNPQAFAYDPDVVGGGVAQYYGNVTSSLPTFAAIQRNIAGIPSPGERAIIGQQAAERGVGIGSYGGANDATAYLRALGLTSRDLTREGIEQYGKTMATIPALNPESLFITPTAQAGMNLEWATSQADINAAMARQRASDAAALERARIAQQTSYGTTGMQLASQERIAAGQRTAAEAYNQQRMAELNAAQQRQAQVSALANQYGVGGYDPWGGGVAAPGGGAGAPAAGEAGAPRGTGSIYFGDQFPSFEAESDVMSGAGSPADYGVGYNYFEPGAGQQAYEPWMDELWF